MFDKPQHIWNCDESGFPSDPKKVKVVSVRGKTAYRVTSGAGTENTTTLAVANAAGKALPPLIVFQGKNFLSTWRSENCIPGTRYGCSENGWMTTELFEWFREFCKKVKERPIVLLYDGHLKFPPHVTDVLQPLDVTCFGPLKQEWEGILEKWCSAFGSRDPIRKATIVQNVCDIWYKGLSESNIKSGFRSTDIFPIDSKKYPCDRFDPRLLKCYKSWVDMGKPEDLPNAIAHSVMTPPKKSHPVASPELPTETSSTTLTMSTKQCSLSTITSNKCFCEGHLGPKPVTIPGKVWVPVSSLQDEAPNITPSTSSTHSNKSFEDILLDKIKGPKEKPVKKRRKIDLKTKVISDEAYLAGIERLEKEDQEKKEKKLLKATSKRSKSKKMNDKRKKR